MTTVEYQLLLQDKFSPTLTKVDKKLKGFNQQVNKTSQGTNKLKKSTGGIGGSLGGLVGKLSLVGVAYGIARVGKAVVGLGADMEQTKVSFSVMLGSMDKAEKMVTDINKFANATPFENDALFETTKLLLNYGVTQEQMLPTMRRLGDVSGGSAEKLNRLALAYGQARALGRLQGQDMKQMIEVGFNPLQEMARTTGKSMGELTKMMSKGQIGVKMLDDAFISATSKGGKFNGMMEKQSKTLAGKFSTFMGKMKMIGIEIGNKVLPVLKKILDGVLNFMQSLTSNFAIVKKVITPVIQQFKRMYEAIERLVEQIFKSADGVSTAAEKWATFAKILKYTLIPLRLLLFVLEKVIGWIQQIIGWIGRMVDKFETLRKIIEVLMLPFDALMDAFDWLNDKLDEDEKGNRIEQLKEQITSLTAEIKKVPTFDLLKKNDLAKQIFEAKKKLAREMGIDTRGLKFSGLKRAGDAATDGLSGLGKIPGLGGASGGTTKSEPTKITGSAPKIFNLNVTKLIENMTIETTNISEGANKVQDIVTMALQKALMDIQTNVR